MIFVLKLTCLLVFALFVGVLRRKALDDERSRIDR